MATMVLVEATAKPEAVEEFKAIWQEILPETRAFEGCQGLTAYLNQDDGRTFVLVEYWDSREHYEKYFQWRVDTGFVDRLGPMLDGEPSIRYFDSLDT